MKKALFAIALLLVINGKAQTDSLGRSFLRFNSVSVNAGVNAVFNQHLNQSQLIQLAPDNSILKSNVTGFSQYSVEHNGNAFISSNLSFNPVNKKTGKPRERIELKIGILFQSNYMQETIFSKTDNIRIDTFSSAATGMTVYKDSTASREYGFVARGKKIGVDLSNTFRLNKNPIFNIYAGYNICAYYSYDNRIEAGRSQGGRRFREWFGPIGYDDEEITHLKNNFLLNASLCGGISTRLCKKKKHIAYREALNAEIRIGVVENKIGNKYVGLSPYFLLTAGLKIYAKRLTLIPKIK